MCSNKYNYFGLSEKDFGIQIKTHFKLNSDDRDILSMSIVYQLINYFNDACETYCIY